jgi:hypothetical protein
MIGENRAVMGFNLIHMFDRIDRLRGLAEELLALGLPPPHIGAEFSFLDAPEAVRLFRGGQTMGKVVLVVDPKTESELQGG